MLLTGKESKSTDLIYYLEKIDTHVYIYIHTYIYIYKKYIRKILSRDNIIMKATF